MLLFAPRRSLPDPPRGRKPRAAQQTHYERLPNAVLLLLTVDLIASDDEERILGELRLVRLIGRVFENGATISNSVSH